MKTRRSEQENKALQPSMLFISEREIEVLTLTSQGFSTQEIATQLYLSRETVKSHRKNLLIKLKARNAAHLVRKGIQYQLIAS